jgi:outer membrane protein OmpA-like peptidoglycan-associated protein
MAELNVQPKSKTPWWLWLILLIVALAILFFFLRGFGNRAGEQSTVVSDSTITTTDSTSTTKVAITQPSFDNVNFDAPKASYEEVTDTTITVRSENQYSIYSLGENVLFAKGESTLQTKASAQLKQIAASLQKRFKNSLIGVYGRTDSSGDAKANQELGTKRAEAVRNWLMSNSELDASKIYVRSYGEAKPVTTNSTSEGRQLNRSVEIVAIPDSATHK